MNYTIYSFKNFNRNICCVSFYPSFSWTVKRTRRCPLVVNRRNVFVFFQIKYVGNITQTGGGILQDKLLQQ